MKFVLDTNVVLRTTQPAHPHLSAAVAAVKRLGNMKQRLCLVPQILFEFWVVATRPIAQHGLGMTVDEANAELARIQHGTTLLEDPAGLFQTWRDLVVSHRVQGKPAHDARIVAAMRMHGVTHILTFNKGDFERYPGIVVNSPLDLQQA